MLDESGYPTPLDPADMQRRLTKLERLVALASAARSLTAAAIGAGGLRVFGGGSIRVEDGGSLYVDKGNLVLGAGTIRGPALKGQIEPGFESATSSTFAISTAWSTSLSLVITRPAWATRTVVSCQAAVTLPTVGAIRGYLTGLGQTLDIYTASRNFGEDTDTVASLAWGGVSTAASITAAIETRTFFSDTTLTPRRADLQVTCTFMR